MINTPFLANPPTPPPPSLQAETRLKEEARRLRDELDAALTTAKNRVKDLEAGFSELDHEATRASEEADRLRQELMTARDAAAAARRELGLRDVEVLDLQKDKDAFSLGLAAAKNEKAEAERRLAAAEARLSAAEAEASDTAARVRGLEARLAELVSEGARLNAELQSGRQKLDAASARLAELKAAMEGLGRERDSLKGDKDR